MEPPVQLGTRDMWDMMDNWEKPVQLAKQVQTVISVLLVQLEKPEAPE
jgi:hypothetical protein